MRTRHSRFSGTRRSAPRRRTAWSTVELTLPSIPSLGVNNTDLYAPFEGSGASTLGTTVLRTLVTLQLPFSVATDNYVIGLIVRNASATTFFDPHASPELDWGWLVRENARQTGAAVDGLVQVRYDIRSKRKVSQMLETWELCVFNGTGVAQTPRLHARTLVALP